VPRNKKKKRTWKPITTPSMEKDKFEWTKEAEVAFKTMKKSLIIAPVLKALDFASKYPYEISSDASNLCIGGVLN
jgi:hypothetical protein